MRMRRVPVVIFAIAIGAGLTACGGSSTSSSAAASAPASGGSAPASSVAGGSSAASAPAPVPSASATPTVSAVATPTATATATVKAHATSPARSTTSARPTSSPTQASSSGSANFTVPSIPGDNIVTAYGSYAKTGARVKVTVCVKQTGKAFSVGAVAYAYNSSGASKNIGAVALNGPGDSECGSTTILFYTAHLTVHAFIGGSGGTIVKTGPTLNLY
jgi:hypothetical protein